MNANTVPSTKHTYGVHKWSDLYGNQVMEVLNQRHISVRVIRAQGLFDPSNEKERIFLAEYFNPGGNSKQKVFVVVDSYLPESRKALIEDNFS